jgi:hypothetical protein
MPHPALLVERGDGFGPRRLAAGGTDGAERHQRIDLADHRLDQIAALVDLGHQPFGAVPFHRRDRRLGPVPGRRRRSPWRPPAPRSPVQLAADPFGQHAGGDDAAFASDRLPR